MKDVYEAEEIVQNTFIYAAKYIKEDTDIDKEEIKGLLFVITHNKAMNVIKQNKRRSYDAIDEDIIDEDTFISPETNILRLDAKQEMAKKLAQLKKEYADILSMKYFLEYSVNEIAMMLDMTESNVKVTLHRARKALNRLMGGDGHEPI